jgi:hypothetical protein
MEEEENNPMKALENRTIDSKREMDILDALQDIRARNSRNERIGDAAIEEMLARKLNEEHLEVDEDEEERRKWEEEDEKIVREVFSKVDNPDDASGNKVTLKRKADGQAPDLKSLLSESSRAMVDAKMILPPPAKKPKTASANSLGVKPARRRPAPVPGASKAS